MCSNRCAKPVRPGFSRPDPTWYQALTLILGVVLEWNAVEAFFGAVGFALSFVFPLVVALAGTRTPSAPATGVALVAGIGSGGGFVAPWLVGAIGDAKGVAFAFGTLAAWCAAVAVATVLGRYHYALDSILGAGLGIVGWWIGFRILEMS